MRYIVKDINGKFHTSYATNIPSFPIKAPLKWAKQTAKHIGGIVSELIVPNSPQYPTKEVELYNYSYRSYKENKKNKNNTSDKKNTKKKYKKNK